MNDYQALSIMIGLVCLVGGLLIATTGIIIRDAWRDWRRNSDKIKAYDRYHGDEIGGAK